MIDHQSEVTKARQIRHLTPLSPTPVQQWRIAIRRPNTIRNWRPLAANRCLFTAITHPPILSLPSTSCCLDPPPTSLLKKFLSTLLILSLLPGCFPSAWKHALISPLLKKPSLDQNLLAHYRSIAFLPFGSKLIERATALQLNEHLSTYAVLSPYQSAYRAGHSIETLLLSVTNDLLLAADEGDASVLLFLDLPSTQLTTTSSWIAWNLTVGSLLMP